MRTRMRSFVRAGAWALACSLVAGGIGGPAAAQTATPEPTPSATPSPTPTDPALPDTFPPRVANVAASNVVLGSRTKLAEIGFDISEDAAIDVVISTGSGTKVKALHQAHAERGRVVMRWAGGGRGGRLVAPGKYRFVIRATDPAGNVSGPEHGTITAKPGSYRSSATRRYTYTVELRGVSTSEKKRFARIGKKTLADVRGWSLRWHIHYKRVSSGGDFRLILASPSAVAAASPVCSSLWSCRVGDQVLINIQRWRDATPTWTGSKRQYRSYVINHEVGHWLGLGHTYCSAPGAPAPVMQQQSKGLQGCKHNVWPLVYERSQVAARHGVSNWQLPPRGSPCTIVGTDASDVSNGTAESDVICGFGGPDEIYGRGGNDVLIGGRGRDHLDGGAGTDRCISAVTKRRCETS